mmetsp:Transcript_7331/g.26191  ORF Transcript_7331/g.26191 Transcript_7331/m.26191 type:complete len:340 (-) Transcript_7331:244-1263(-)
METRSSPARPELVSFAREMLAVGPKVLETAPKAELFEYAQRLGFDRWLRRNKRRERSFESEEAMFDDSAPAHTAESEPVLDPITREPIEGEPFVFTRPGGSCALFGVAPLVSYIVSSGKFEDPLSRCVFSDADLARLDDAARRQGLNLPSVVEARSRPHDYEERRSREDHLMGLERCIGEGVARMLDLLDEAASTPLDDIQTELLVSCFPQTGDFVGQMVALDASAAAMALSSFVAVVHGPAGRPNANPNGLRDVFEAFLGALQGQLRRVADAADDESAAYPAGPTLDVFSATQEAFSHLVLPDEPHMGAGAGGGGVAGGGDGVHHHHQSHASGTGFNT